MNKKGFTLIEVLIVVVIIAVLASLVMPKLLPQTERAVVSEGIQTLGVLQRAQNQLMDLTGGTTWTAVANNTAFKDTLNVEIKTGSKYNYECTTDSCVAKRIDDDSKSITFKQDGSVTCGTGYTAVKHENKTIGCA